MTRCERCGFLWKEEYEAYPTCHYEGPADWAPCEQDDEENNDE